MNPLYSLTLLLSLFFLPQQAFAHSSPHSHGSFYEGIIHPITGLDHLFAIFFVGILASRQSGENSWKLPAFFIGSILFGSLAGVAHAHLHWMGIPHIHSSLIETMVSLSLVVIGLLVTLNMKIDERMSSILVAFFAMFHGYAHGNEQSFNIHWAGFEAGFIIATAGLLAGGFYLSKTIGRNRLGNRILTCSGVAVAIIGALFLMTPL